MARGFGAREAAPASSIPSAKDEKYKLSNRLETMAAMRRSLSKWLARSELIGAGKSSIKEAKDTLAVYEKVLDGYEKVVESVKSGDLTALLPDKDGDSLDSEGLKMVSAQKLKAEGVKYGPNINQMSDDELGKMLAVGSDKEHLLVFDKNGDYAYGMSGKKDEVGGSWPQEAAGNPRGYTNYKGQEIHTHPVSGKNGRVFGGPPSPEDVDRLIRTGISKSTIIAPEGKYVIEISDGIRAGISATGKDLAGVTKIAGDMMGNMEIAWRSAQRKSGNDWENNPQTFAKFIKAMSSEFMQATGGNLGLTFIPNKEYENMAFSQKGL